MLTEATNQELLPKSINTLIRDIYDVLKRDGRSVEDHFSQNIVGEINTRLVERFGPRDERATLRLSKMGENCPRSVWASVHSPSLQEKPTGQALFKFTYGDVIEGLVVGLAKSAGHEVTGEQDAVYLDGIKGHRDCVIDGAVVDVKSANSLSFQKVKAGLVSTDIFLRDYLDQLDGYVVGAIDADDPLVRIRDRAYLLFVDKVLGHMHLYEHRIRPDHIRQRVAYYKSIVASEEAPACTCKTVPDRDSGGFRLDTKASYNPFKYACFPDLRTVIRSGKPVNLTGVTRPLRDPEVDRNGVFH